VTTTVPARIRKVIKERKVVMVIGDTPPEAASLGKIPIPRFTCRERTLLAAKKHPPVAVPRRVKG
jgi:hypothetical protein